MEVLLTIALQGALIGTLIMGTERLPKGEWNDKPLSLVQAKALQGFLALCIVFHHCAQRVFFERWGTTFSPCGLEVMALMGYCFVGYFFFCSGYGLYQGCQNKKNYLDDFLRRRALPLILIYFICNTAYLVGRLAMGETFGFPRLVLLLFGLELANPNAWFVVMLPLMYLLFYISKRNCADDALVTRRLFLGAGACILVGMVITMANLGGGRYGVFLGRWWYNTIILFPMGYLFGCKEVQAWLRMRESYRKQVACSVVLCLGCFLLSLLFMMVFPLVPLSMVFESLSTIGFTWGLLLFSLRRRTSGGFLSFYGGLTLELYLMHGFFVNLFYRPFYDKGIDVLTISNPAIYILLVLACATVLALLFKRVTKAIFCAVQDRVRRGNPRG
ncbi:MAG: acyltransferase [Coriobacteriales bacterium]|nr:acyltransferase [Coriobacteriales bacterium]